MPSVRFDSDSGRSCFSSDDSDGIDTDENLNDTDRSFIDNIEDKGQC